MSLTIAEIEALMNDEPIGEKEVEFLSEDEINNLIGIDGIEDEDIEFLKDHYYKSIDKSSEKQNYNLKKNLAKFEKLFLLDMILYQCSDTGFDILAEASGEAFLGFGESFKANLEEYENMTTRYLKQANISYKDTIVPLIMHYQSNFLEEVLDLEKCDEIFPIFEYCLKCYYETLSLSPILEEITYTPPDESEPILSYAFDFFDANDLRGQFLISIPYNNFLQWEGMEEYQVFDQNDLEKAEELDELEDVLANLNKSRFVEEGFEEYYCEFDDYQNYMNDFQATQNEQTQEHLTMFQTLFDKIVFWSFPSITSKNTTKKASLGFGESFKTNLDEFPNMTTKYLKQSNLLRSYCIKAPLIIHFQSNFESESFNSSQFEKLFESIYTQIDYAYNGLSITFPQEVDFVPKNSSEPFLHYSLDFYDEENDARGEILIALPYFAFIQWRKKEYLSAEEVAYLLDAYED